MLHKGMFPKALCATALAVAFGFSVLPAPAYAVDQEKVDAALERLNSLGSDLASLQEQLSEATAGAQDLSEAADAKGEEVVAAQEELSQRREALSTYMKSNYKQQASFSALGFLLGSHSFEELSNRIFYLDRINASQAERISSVKEAEAQLAQEQSELEVQKAAQQEKVAELEELVLRYQTYADEAAKTYNALTEEEQEAVASSTGEDTNVAAALTAVEYANSDREELMRQDAEREDSKSANADPGTSSSGSDSRDSGSSGSNSSSSSTSEKTYDPVDTGGSSYDSSSRSRDTYLSNVTWTGDSEYINALANRASGIGSSTSFFITFDNELCRVIVFQRSGGTWRPVKVWNCNGGRNTYSGVWTIAHKQICNWSDEYFGRGYNDWSTCYIESYTSYNPGHLRYIPGKGYEDCASIHSTGETTTGWANTGCCGLLWENAKWVYDNVPVGTTLYEFRYSNIF